MEHQFQTRGIYRPNAQRLSISLAPLVAQRSLLFRVRADLNSKAHYGELTPTTGESDMELFALTASTVYVLTAVMSVASSISAASVYSQDSWKGGPSPFVASLQNVDTRRHAIAFSPDVNWSDLNKDASQVDEVLDEEMVEVPLRSSISEPEVIPPTKVFNPNDVLNSIAANFPVALKAAIPPTATAVKTELASQDENSTKLQKRRKTMADAAKRTTKYSNTFSKVISRISLQPSKKEISALEKRQLAMDISSNPVPKLKLSDLKPITTNVTDYKLPELKTPGPIRMSFIVGSKPQASAVPVLAPLRIPPPSIAIIAEDSASEARAKEFERRRLLLTSTPVTASWRSRSLTPPPPITPAPKVAPEPVTRTGRKRMMSTPAVMKFDFHGWDEERSPVVAPQAEKKKMGHKRFKSSPAVMNFDLQKRTENIPPVPPMPANLPLPLKVAPAPMPEPGYRRGRSLSLAGRAPNVRAVVPPFPLPQARLNGSF